MKKTVLIAIFLCIMVCNGNANKIVISNPDAANLLEKMYLFFIETLRSNYHIENEQLVMMKFLDTYTQTWEELIENKDRNLTEFTFDLNVDDKKLEIVNQYLFISDSSHYFYFYPAFAEELEPEELDSLNLRIERYCPEISRRFLRKADFVFPRYEGKIQKFSQSHNIYLANRGGFVRDLINSDSKFSLALAERAQLEAEIFFYDIARFLSRDKPDLLKSKDIHKILAVVFWKLLCLQDDIEFHRLPKCVD